MRRLTNVAHGHIIQWMDGICSCHPNITAHITVTSSTPRANDYPTQHNSNTSPSPISTITHADKVMHALADCVKALQGMRRSARNSQGAHDLQRIIEATKAHVQARPDRFEDVATLSTTPNMQLRGCRHPACYEFRGCSFPQVYPQPTLMIPKGSHAPCLRSHQF
jgi:hypothetical protein